MWSCYQLIALVAIVSNVYSGIVVNSRPCRKPTWGCDQNHHRYKAFDCDGDGKLDHTCHSTKSDMRWLILSTEGCPNSWGPPDRKVSKCPQVFPKGMTQAQAPTNGDCRKPTWGCEYQSSDHHYKAFDCDGDGKVDHACYFMDHPTNPTTKNLRWLILSTEGCPYSWGKDDRKVSDCPSVFPKVIPKVGKWSGWSNWSTCSATCNGVKTRYRTCQSAGKSWHGSPGNPLRCKGSGLDIRTCDPCTPSPTTSTIPPTTPTPTPPTTTPPAPPTTSPPTPPGPPATSELPPSTPCPTCDPCPPNCDPCPPTCGQCHPKTCVDSKSKCLYWARAGYCTVAPYSGYLSRTCCNSCTGALPVINVIGRRRRRHVEKMDEELNKMMDEELNEIKKM